MDGLSFLDRRGDYWHVTLLTSLIDGALPLSAWLIGVGLRELEPLILKPNDRVLVAFASDKCDIYINQELISTVSAQVVYFPKDLNKYSSGEVILRSIMNSPMIIDRQGRLVSRVAKRLVNSVFGG